MQDSASPFTSLTPPGNLDSSGKGTEKVDNTQNNNENIVSLSDKTTVDADDKVSIAGGESDSAVYRLREADAPKNTGIGYKVFVLKNGKLYPPMVANPGGEATPVGVWLDADAAPVAGQSKTGRPQVKAGGKGKQGGSGVLAYRPGWHLGEIPYAIQFNRLNPTTGEKELFSANFVWAEVEYANDVDYQKERQSMAWVKTKKIGLQREVGRSPRQRLHLKT